MRIYRLKENLVGMIQIQTNVAKAQVAGEVVDLALPSLKEVVYGADLWK